MRKLIIFLFILFLLGFSYQPKYEDYILEIENPTPNQVVYLVSSIMEQLPEFNIVLFVKTDLERLNQERGTIYLDLYFKENRELFVYSQDIRNKIKVMIKGTVYEFPIKQGEK